MITPLPSRLKPLHISWSYNPETGELTRILTAPDGAETTSPYVHKLGDEHYMTVVTQHPDSSTSNAYGDTVTGVLRLGQGGRGFGRGDGQRRKWRD